MYKPCLWLELELWSLKRCHNSSWLSLEKDRCTDCSCELFCLLRLTTITVRRCWHRTSVAMLSSVSKKASHVSLISFCLFFSLFMYLIRMHSIRSLVALCESLMTPEVCPAVEHSYVFDPVLWSAPLFNCCTHTVSLPFLWVFQMLFLQVVATVKHCHGSVVYWPVLLEPNDFCDKWFSSASFF